MNALVLFKVVVNQPFRGAASARAVAINYRGWTTAETQPGRKLEIILSSCDQHGLDHSCSMSHSITLIER